MRNASVVLSIAGRGGNVQAGEGMLVRNFVYTDAQARHLSVHSRGVLEALRTIYGAVPLAAELTRER